MIRQPICDAIAGFGLARTAEARHGLHRCPDRLKSAAMAFPRNTISVIIPAYNRRREILRAIASVFSQTMPPDEILIVDDGSSDGTPDVVAELHDSRIKILQHANNRGASAARNTGIEAARGDWIAFLDSDDEWDHRKLAEQYDALLNSPCPEQNLASVTGYIIQDYRTGEIRRLLPTPRDATLDALVWGCPLGLGSTLLARREAFSAVGLLDPELPRLEDWEWLMRYLPAHSLHVVQEPLAIVHKAGDPSFARVTAATTRIREKHRAMWYRRSWIDGRKFDSTLLVEEAAAAYYARNLAGAASLSLRALATYPLRGNGFVGMLTHRTVTAWRRKVSVQT
jgi:glycosyltransferase involved in cell wall biosynthesis